MKKNLTNIVSLMLILAMMLTLAGCATDKDKLVGEWVCVADYSESFNEGMEEGLGEELSKYFDEPEFIVTINLEFREDGTYVMELDEDAFEDTMDGVMQTIEDGLYTYFEDALEAEGVDMTVEELMEEENMSMDDLIGIIFTDEVMDEIVEEFKTSTDFKGNFDAEDGKLFTTAKKSQNIDEDLYEEYELEDDTLTLTSTTHDIDDEAEDLYPIVFERVG